MEYKEVLKRALANAAYFNRKYAVFCDTSGNWRCCQDHLAPCGLTGLITIARPDGSHTEYHESESDRLTAQTGMTDDQRASL